MSLTVIFKDPEQQIIVIENVDEDITIKELRNLFKEKGGNESEGQWKWNATMLENDRKLSSYMNSYMKGKIKKVTISTVASVRGGWGV